MGSISHLRTNYEDDVLKDHLWGCRNLPNNWALFLLISLILLKKHLGLHLGYFNKMLLISFSLLKKYKHFKPGRHALP